MKVLPDGRYQLEDGTIVPRDKLGQMYLEAPLSSRAQTEQEEKEESELKEGQSSGVIDLVEG